MTIVVSNGGKTQSLLKVSSQCILILLLRDQTTYIDRIEINNRDRDFLFIERSIDIQIFMRSNAMITGLQSELAAVGFDIHNTPVSSLSEANSRLK